MTQRYDCRIGETYSKSIGRKFPVFKCNLCIIFKHTHNHAAILKTLTFNVVPLFTFYIACVATHNFKAGICDSLLFTAVGHLYKMLVLEQTYFFISGIIGMKNFIDNRNHKFRTISKKCTEYIIVWCTGHSVFPFFKLYLIIGVDGK